MTKDRVMVLRLFGGGYLDRTGRSTTSPAKAVQLLEADARQLRYTSFGYIDRNDLLWGSSLEMLKKRKPHTSLSADEYRAFLVALKTVRLIAEADRYERLADGYVAQARHAEQMAAQMRAKADQLRLTA